MVKTTASRQREPGSPSETNGNTDNESNADEENHLPVDAVTYEDRRYAQIEQNKQDIKLKREITSRPRRKNSTSDNINTTLRLPQQKKICREKSRGKADQ